MRTRLSICIRKRRFATEREASEAARTAGLPLHPYRCDRCGKFHLTSRTKGKRLLPDAAPRRPGGGAQG